MRILGRFLILVLASYGPLAPVMIAFLVAMPILIAFSGWPWWLDLTIAGVECGLIAGVAIWHGPEALAAAREFLEQSRRE
ncbi:MAG TPA: hypothetical protein VMG74_04640 [Gaiellaceae bacterium]|nr:hypothetical protein [Gaiellaceae bacterium]